MEQCQEAGLVWGKELSFDATQVNANADLDSLTLRFAVEAREAIQAHLATLFTHEDSEHEQQDAAADQADTAGGVLPLDVVENSTSPQRTHVGLGFASLDAPERGLHSGDPGTSPCFPLPQAACCSFTGRRLTSFMLL